MRIAYWDTSDPEMYFDNTNLRWGSPAYLLEPGDPGYVPPSSSVTETINKKTKKHMKRNTYFPIRVGDQIIWCGTFRDQLPALATVLSLTTAQVTAAVADCGWLIYVLQSWLPDVRTWALGCTTAATAAQTGSGPVQVLPVFVPPALPTGVAPVALGAQLRIFALVQQIKDSGKCNDNNARILGIVGSEQTGPDLDTLQPVIKPMLASGGHVLVKWNWQGHGGYLGSCEIWVDRGDGKGFVFLTIDTTPDYTDTTPLPATPAKWTYKAIYRVGEAQVGQWSAPVSVNVGG